jgi:hypothetical protein
LEDKTHPPKAVERGFPAGRKEEKAHQWCAGV